MATPMQCAQRPIVSGRDRETLAHCLPINRTAFRVSCLERISTRKWRLYKSGGHRAESGSTSGATIPA